MNKKKKGRKVWECECYELEGQFVIDAIKEELVRNKIYDQDKKFRITVEEIQ